MHLPMGVRRFAFCLVFATYLCYMGRCDYPGVQQMNSKDFIGEDIQSGFTAAFGDVNSDKQTDVFVLSETGEEVFVFLGASVSPDLSLHQKMTLEGAATSVVPADFNGDDVTDLLATFKSDNSYTFSIYWGLPNQSFSSQNVFISVETFIDEPLVLDANADMIADVFVVYANNTRGFLVGEIRQDNWQFVPKPFETEITQELNDVVVPHSHAFIDLMGRGSANLFITAKVKGILRYEIWEGAPGGLILSKTINTAESEYFKDSSIIFGPTTFADFTGNARQDIVVATCTPNGDECKNGKIVIFTDDKWHILYTISDDWTFPNSGELLHTNNALHISDFNLDSYPDIMMIMQNKNKIRKAVLLYNVKCTSDYCSAVGRQLGKMLEMPSSENALLSAFYDFSMDGTIDVIVTTKTKEEEKYTMKAYKNMIADDVTFLRVQVLSGLSEEPVFGVNVAGPLITYETTNISGEPQRGCLGQLSQSAHLALQLPYVIFGLGRLANFVDSLTVSVPVPLIVDPESPIVEKVDGKEKNSRKTINMTISTDAFKPLNATWPMLIPNSQLYVIPYPKESPNSWKNKLLVTPSQNVIMTAVVLLATCGVLGIATMILHWLERREDKQEKIQEAYRFHFDAM